jgi:hypothetical protein
MLVKQCILVCVIGANLFPCGLALADDKHVTVMATPGHGIQPQAVMDAHGNLHLLYFQGDAGSGNLQYVRRDAGETEFSKPLRVNSQQESAIATGTIRGGHLAVGKNDRVHVSWNGSSKALPKNPITGSPMLYARLNDQGTAFEPQRNLMTQSSILDGGGSLAADALGNVYVAWHAVGKEVEAGEGNRKVWISMSRDDGKTFAAEKSAWDEPTGACGCCGLRGFADLKGDTYFVYRAATAKINRGMYLIRSSDRGKSFDGVRLDNWKIASCPMSSEAFAEGPSGVYGAWDNDGQVYVARVGPGKIAIPSPRAAPGAEGDRKHPALTVNKNGDVILVWAEGTGWERGGNLAWQVYDKAGNPTAESGVLPRGIPVWGMPAVVAETDGRFTIFH